MVGSERSTQVRVKVFPKSGRSEVEGFRNGVLIIRLKSAPDKGKANLELINTLSEYYGVSKSAVTIVSGSNRRVKTVKIKKI